MEKWSRTPTTFHTTDTIKEALHSAEIIDRLNELDKDLDKITVPVVVSRLRKILLKLAEDSMGKIDFNKSENPQKSKNHVPWMNDECRLLKRQLNISRKNIRKPSNLCMKILKQV